MNLKLTKYEQMYVENIQKQYNKKHFIIKMLVPILATFLVYYFRTSYLIIPFLGLILFHQIASALMINNINELCKSIIKKMIVKIEELEK